MSTSDAPSPPPGGTDREALFTAPTPLVSESDDWKPGDPCLTCGSDDTLWVADGVLMQAHCNGCGRDDWDDD